MKEPPWITEGCADGETYDHPQDHDRLSSQRAMVLDLMLDGQWRTLGMIRHATGHAEASISARLRDFRKPKFGEYTVERRRVSDGQGLYEYRVQSPPAPVVLGQMALFSDD